MAESITPNGYEYGILPDSQTPFWRGDEMPLLGQLKDVDVKEAADHYVLMYDILSQTWKAKKMIDDNQVSEGVTYSSKKIEELIASIPGGGGGEPGTNNYEDLTNKPSIAGVTLSGNKTLHQLGIQGELQPVGYVHIANGEIYVEIPIDDTATDSEHIWSAQKVISMLATKANISSFQNYYTKNEVDNLISQAGGGTLHDLKQKNCFITKNVQLEGPDSYGIKFTAEDTGKLLWMDTYGQFDIELNVDGTRYFMYTRGTEAHYPLVFPVPSTNIYEKLPRTVFLIPLRKQGSSEVILAEGYYNYEVTQKSGEYYIGVTGVTIMSVYSMYEITSVEFDSGWTFNAPSYNYQMYSHDGGGSGSNVIVNQILSSGVQIAQIVVDGVPTSIYAPSGGGSVPVGGLRVYGPYNVKFGSSYAHEARGQDARRLHDEYCVGNINMSIFNIDSKIGYDADFQLVSKEGDSNIFTRYAVGATNRGYRMWAKIVTNYNSALSEPFDYTMSVYFECDEDVTSNISSDTFKINSSSQVHLKEVPDTTPIKMIDGNDQDPSITPLFPTIATAAMVAGTINVTTNKGTLSGDFVGMYDPTFSNNSLQFTGEVSGVLEGPDAYIGQSYGKIGRNGGIDLHMTFFDEDGNHLPDFEVTEITVPVLRVVEVPQNPGNTFLTSGQVSVTGTSPEINTSRDYLVSCTFGTLKASGVFNHNTTGALLNRNVVTLNVSYATSLSQASNAVYTIVIPLVGDGTVKTFDTTATVIKLGMVNEVPNIPVSDIRIKEIADFSSDISSLAAVNSLQTSELGSLAAVNSLQTSEMESMSQAYSMSCSEMQSEIDWIKSELATN